MRYMIMIYAMYGFWYYMYLYVHECIYIYIYIMLYEFICSQILLKTALEVWWTRKKCLSIYQRMKLDSLESFQAALSSS